MKPEHAIQKQLFCRTCDQHTLHVAYGTETDIDWSLRVAMCIITCGFWIPLALLTAVLGTLVNAIAAPGNYDGQRCGHRY